MKKTFFTAGLALAFIFVSCNQPSSTTDQETVVTQESTTETVAVEFKDFGPEPFVFDIEAYTTQNETFRTAVWTGTSMQMTVMTIQPGDDIGLELHTTIDQFLRVEEGSGLLKMGDTEDSLHFEQRLEKDFAAFIPAGKWHNLVNDTDKPLKLYSIYAPVEHPHSTVHQTKADGGEPHAH